MYLKSVKSLLLIISLTIITACDKENEEKGNAKFLITDAPIDNTEVKGAFVTISEIKIDGKSVEGFNKTTIDLLAYQNGNTKTLFNSSMEAKSYSKVSLVLDFDKDEKGNSPGCYIKETGDSIHMLTSDNNTIEITNEIDIEANTESEFVLDFDLRKSIVKEEGGSSKYNFVTSGELQKSVRLIKTELAGKIKGNCNDVVTNSDKIVVYAYNKGSFYRDTEVNGQGESNIQFANAISSATVQADGSYQLSFLQEGEYELHFCSYQENDQGESEADGTLLIEAIGNASVESVALGASATATVNVSVTGLLPILE